MVHLPSVLMLAGLNSLIYITLAAPIFGVCNISAGHSSGYSGLILCRPWRYSILYQASSTKPSRVIAYSNQGSWWSGNKWAISISGLKLLDSYFSILTVLGFSHESMGSTTTSPSNLSHRRGFPIQPHRYTPRQGGPTYEYRYPVPSDADLGMTNAILPVMFDPFCLYNANLTSGSFSLLSQKVRGWTPWARLMSII